MDYAIKQLEQTEEILKEMIEGLTEFEVDTQDLRVKLAEIQTAILVIYASQELINIGHIQSLKTPQK